MFPEAVRKVSRLFAVVFGRTSVGVDVGREAVRVVVLRQGRGGVSLAGLGSAAMTGDAPAVALRAALRSGCRRVAWRLRRVVLAVPADAVLVRALPIGPGASAEEQAEALEHAARLLPLPANELRLASAPTAAPLHHDGDRRSADVAVGGTSSRVCMVAVRRQVVRERQTLAMTCGLGRVVIDVDVFAAMRGLQAKPGRGIVSASSARAPLPMLVDAAENSVRALVWPEGGVPLLQVVPAPRLADTEALGAIVVALAGELAASSGARPDAIVLAGDGLSGDDIAQSIARRAGLAARFADPFDGVASDTGIGRPPEGPAAAPWLTAYGLALRGLV